MGRVDVFLRSTVVIAQERVGEESSTHVLELSRWKLPLFPVVEPPVVRQDASSRRRGGVESPLPRAKRDCLAARMRGVSSTHKQFMMCDNGYNTLSTPGVFEGLRYRPWMHGTWEEYQGASTPDARRQVLLLAYARYEGEDSHHPKSPRVLRELRKHWLEGKPKVWRGSVFTADELERLNEIRQSRLDPECPWWQPRRDSVNQ